MCIGYDFFIRNFFVIFLYVILGEQKLFSYTYYTDNLPPGVGGTTKTFVIAIRPQYKDDERMHLHWRNRTQSLSMAMPSTGTYTIGEFVWNSTPSIASGKVLLGWSRLTTGSAHVLNTDWTPCYTTTA